MILSVKNYLKQKEYLLFFILFINTACLKLAWNDEQIRKEIIKSNYAPNLQYLQLADRTIRYLTVGHDSLPMLVLIHGSPGSLMGYKSYLTDSLILKNFRVLALDKVGYGGSEQGGTEISIEKQAYYVKTLIEKEKKEGLPVFIMAASYGGSVATRIVMDYPSLAQGLMLISSSVIPHNETTYWVSYKPFWQLVKWALPKFLWVANEEKLSHHKQLTQMLPLWNNIKTPTFILHSQEDDLIYVANAHYAHQHIVNAPSKLVILEEGNHYIIWNNKELVLSNLFELKQLVKQYYQTPIIKFKIHIAKEKNTK